MSLPERGDQQPPGVVSSGQSAGITPNRGLAGGVSSSVANSSQAVSNGLGASGHIPYAVSSSEPSGQVGLSPTGRIPLDVDSRPTAGDATVGRASAGRKINESASSDVGHTSSATSSENRPGQSTPPVSANDLNPGLYLYNIMPNKVASGMISGVMPHLATSDNVLPHLATSGNILPHIATSGNIVPHMATSGNNMPYMATSGNMMPHLATSGNNMPQMATSRQITSYAVSRETGLAPLFASSRGPNGESYVMNGSRGYCYVCKLELTSEAHASSHLTGKKHKKKNWDELVNGNAGNAPADATFSPDNSRVLMCSVCNVPFSSPENARQHFVSDKHRKKLSSTSNFAAVENWPGTNPDLAGAMKLGQSPAWAAGGLRLHDFAEDVPVSLENNEDQAEQLLSPNRVFSKGLNTNTCVMSGNKGICTVCNISLTSLQHCREHMLDSEHIKKEKEFFVGKMPEMYDPEQTQVMKVYKSPVPVTSAHGIFPGPSADAGNIFENAELQVRRQQLLPLNRELQAGANSEAYGRGLKAGANSEAYVMRGDRGFCYACNLELTSQQHCNQHVYGKKHIKKAMEWSSRKSYGTADAKQSDAEKIHQDETETAHSRPELSLLSQVNKLLAPPFHNSMLDSTGTLNLITQSMPTIAYSNVTEEEFSNTESEFSTRNDMPENSQAQAEAVKCETSPRSSLSENDVVSESNAAAAAPSTTDSSTVVKIETCEQSSSPNSSDDHTEVSSSENAFVSESNATAPAPSTTDSNMVVKIETREQSFFPNSNDHTKDKLQSGNLSTKDKLQSGNLSSQQEEPLKVVDKEIEVHSDDYDEHQNAGVSITDNSVQPSDVSVAKKMIENSSANIKVENRQQTTEVSASAGSMQQTSLQNSGTRQTYLMSQPGDVQPASHQNSGRGQTYLMSQPGDVQPASHQNSGTGQTYLMSQPGDVQPASHQNSGTGQTYLKSQHGDLQPASHQNSGTGLSLHPQPALEMRSLAGVLSEFQELSLSSDTWTNFRSNISADPSVQPDEIQRSPQRQSVTYKSQSDLHKTPNDPLVSPSKPQQTPNDPHASPSKLQKTPDDPHASPSKPQQTPDDPHASPSKLQKTPNDPHASPSEPQKTLNDLHSSPSKLPKTPNDPHVGPSYLQKTPFDSNMSPSLLQKTPNNPHATLLDKQQNTNFPHSSLSDVQLNQNFPHTSLSDKQLNQNVPHASPSDIQQNPNDPRVSLSDLQHTPNKTSHQHSDLQISSSELQQTSDEISQQLLNPLQKTTYDPSSSPPDVQHTANKTPRQDADPHFNLSDLQKTLSDPRSSSSDLQQTLNDPRSSSTYLQQTSNKTSRQDFDPTSSSSHLQQTLNDPHSSATYLQQTSNKMLNVIPSLPQQPLHPNYSASNPDSNRPLPYFFNGANGYCYCCSVELTSLQHANQHLYGQRHKKRSEQWELTSALQNRPFQQNPSPADQTLPPDGNLTNPIGNKSAPYYFNGSTGHCYCCSVELTSLQHANQHLYGQRHKKRSEQWELTSALQNGPSQQPQPALERQVQQQTEDSSYYFNGDRGFCRVCNIELTSFQHTQQHISGRPHKRTKERFNRSQNGVEYPLNCQICSKLFTGQESAQQHFTSAKHQSRAEVLNESVNVLSVVDEGRVIMRDGQVWHVCDVCKVAMNTREQFLFHRESSKHKRECENSKNRILLFENGPAEFINDIAAQDPSNYLFRTSSHASSSRASSVETVQDELDAAAFRAMQVKFEDQYIQDEANKQRVMDENRHYLMYGQAPVISRNVSQIDSSGQLSSSRDTPTVAGSSQPPVSQYSPVAPSSGAPPLSQFRPLAPGSSQPPVSQYSPFALGSGGPPLSQFRPIAPSSGQLPVNRYNPVSSSSSQPLLRQYNPVVSGSEQPQSRENNPVQGQPLINRNSPSVSGPPLNSQDIQKTGSATAMTLINGSGASPSLEDLVSSGYLGRGAMPDLSAAINPTSGSQGDTDNKNQGRHKLTDPVSSDNSRKLAHFSMPQTGSGSSRMYEDLWQSLGAGGRQEAGLDFKMSPHTRGGANLANSSGGNSQSGNAAGGANPSNLSAGNSQSGNAAGGANLSNLSARNSQSGNAAGGANLSNLSAGNSQSGNAAGGANVSNLSAGNSQSGNAAGGANLSNLSAGNSQSGNAAGGANLSNLSAGNSQSAAGGTNLSNLSAGNSQSGNAAGGANLSNLSAGNSQSGNASGTHTSDPRPPSVNQGATYFSENYKNEDDLSSGQNHLNSASEDNYFPDNPGNMIKKPQPFKSRAARKEGSRNDVMYLDKKELDDEFDDGYEEENKDDFNIIEESLPEVIAPPPPPVQPMRSSKPGFRYYCPTCNKHMNTRETYQAHIQGKNHVYMLSCRPAPVRKLEPVCKINTDEGDILSRVLNIINKELKIKPRFYQIELVLKAMKGDCIIYLPTGTGKTLVAVLTMGLMLQDNPSRPVLFLVDKVLLVMQQAQYIIRHFAGTLFKRQDGDLGSPLVTRELLVKPICGGMTTKTDLPIWKHDIVVTTAAYCANMLDRGQIRWEDFSLVVLDEVHHCGKGHPYQKLMSSYHCSLPEHARGKVLGLTASPAGKSTVEQTYIMLKNLLKNLGGASVAVVEENNDVLDRYQSMAKVKSICVPMSSKEKDFKEHLLVYFILCYSQLALMTNNLQSNEPPCSFFLDALRKPGDREVAAQLAEKFIEDPEPLSEVLEVIFKARCIDEVDVTGRNRFDNLRLHICQLLLIIPEVGSGADIEELLGHLSPSGITEEFKKMGLPCDQIYERSVRFANDGNNDLTMFSKLVETLQDPDVINWADTSSRALVLVRERKRAKQYCLKLRAHPMVENKNLRVGYIVGHGKGAKDGGMDVKKQRRVFDNHEKYHILVATSIMEEGIDIQALQLVVCMNPPNSLRALVQMRGRARREGSHFVVLCSSQEDVDKLNGLQRQEQNMQAAAKRCLEESR